MRKAIFTVPVPDKCLSPNARVHWAKKIKPKKTAQAYMIAEVNRLGWSGAGWLECIMNVKWFKKTAHAPDDDNAWARLKATRDALEVSGMVVNDRNVKQGTMEFFVDKLNERLEIEVIECTPSTT